MNIALICIISVLELGLAKFCNGLIVSFGLGLLIYIYHYYYYSNYYQYYYLSCSIHYYYLDY